MSRKDLDHDSIVKLYSEEKKTIKEIAKKCRCSYSTIQRILIANNVEKRRQGSAKKPKTNIDFEEVKRLYFEEMKNAQEIAEIYDVSKKTIYSLFKKQKQKIRVKGEGRRFYEIDKEDVMEMLERKSVQEVADFLEVPYFVIYNVKKEKEKNAK